VLLVAEPQSHEKEVETAKGLARGGVEGLEGWMENIPGSFQRPEFKEGYNGLPGHREVYGNWYRYFFPLNFLRTLVTLDISRTISA